MFPFFLERYESDATLSDALDGQLGQAFPGCLETFMLGSRVNTNLPQDRRDTMVSPSMLVRGIRIDGAGAQRPDAAQSGNCDPNTCARGERAGHPSPRVCLGAAAA